MDIKVRAAKYAVRAFSHSTRARGLARQKNEDGLIAAVTASDTHRPIAAV
jgi:hypothetical protein